MTKKEKKEKSTFLGGIKLANGRELETTNPEEIANFLASNGTSIDGLPKKKRRGGKSKGARTPRGKPVARRTASER